jgi:hypothetical protein
MIETNGYWESTVQWNGYDFQFTAQRTADSLNIGIDSLYCADIAIPSIPMGNSLCMGGCILVKYCDWGIEIMIDDQPGECE